jgi:hypothetical protein
MAITTTTSQPVVGKSHVSAQHLEYHARGSMAGHVAALRVDNRLLYFGAAAALFSAALILFEIGLRAIYLQAYPQDYFLELDGIYRMSIGQKIFIDFSTPFGIALYAVPLMFLHFTSDLAMSVNYATALYLAVAFMVVMYLTWTRLSPELGLALSIWIALAIATRMVTGGSPNVVTLAGNYNRNPEAALALALLIFRASRQRASWIAFADGIIYGFLAGFAFYTKITYGLVALAFVPVVVYAHYRRLLISCGMFVMLGIFVLAIEYAYGTQFQWIPATRMMIASGDSASLIPIIQVVSLNIGEILVCFTILMWYLWRNHRFTPEMMVFIAMIAGSSVLLARSNGSYSFLFLPAILFFVVAPGATSRFETPLQPQQVRGQYVLFVVTLVIVTLQSAPEFSNVVISAYRSATEQPMMRGHEVLERIVTRSIPGEEISGLQSKTMHEVNVASLDAFGIGRAFRPSTFGDNLTMSEFREYLLDGMRAAREHCNNQDRILTMDLENPFPLLLGWPEGGGMIVLHPDRFLSRRAHLPPQEMFKNIDCVLVPKLPVYMAARDFMLEVYGPYLAEHFPISRQTSLWTVRR